jgi:hypothetical protein
MTDSVAPLKLPTRRPSPVPPRAGVLQRQCACGGTPGLTGECAACRTKRLRLQRQATGPALATVPPIVNAVLGSPGQPLDRETRAWAEPRFGHDFARVRVHADATAANSARAVDALAYTVGPHIAFAERLYAPGSTAGRRLLAHELTHVVQQAAGAPGPVALPVPGEDRAAEQEAEAAAAGIAAAGDVKPALRVRAGTIQRLDIEDCYGRGHAAEVYQAVADADPRVRTTISKISAGTRTPDVDAALARFFGTLAPRFRAGGLDVDVRRLVGPIVPHIARQLAIISSRLRGATIECENPGTWFYDHFCGGTTYGYVRSIPAYFGFGSIHVCQPDFHNLTPLQRMATLIHEGAHRYIDATRDTYFTDDCQATPATNAMSDLERLNNADSYGCLVQTLG